MDVWVASVWGYFVNDYIHGSGIAALFIQYIFNFLRSYRLFSKETVPFYIPIRNVWIFSFLSSLVLGVLSVFWIPAFWWANSDISLCFDLVSIMTSDAEHLFMCSLAISVSLVICLFSLSPIFKLNCLPCSPLSLDLGYLLLCSYIFPSMVVQQLVAILVFSQEKMSAHPSTRHVAAPLMSWRGF